MTTSVPPCRPCKGWWMSGATHLILNLRPPFPAGIVARLAEQVIPQIQA